MTPVRVLVVEDSLTVSKRIVEAFERAPDFEVVGEARDGKTGIELCQSLRPDVITMDMMLPVMTGLAATEYIMAYCPTPILIVSASTNRGELFRTYDALAAGALDVIEKPLGDEPDGEWEAKLVESARIVSRIRVITHLRARLGGSDGGASAREPAPAGAASGHAGVVAIGASTGGPAAVLSVLKALPPSFPLPILLVVHISEPFGRALAEWLDGQTGLAVRYAKDGERLPDPGVGSVLMAPPERHLELRGRRLHLTDALPRHSCRPSVDVLFESLARETGSSTVACLLTGMGRDGALGLLEIRNAGGITVAQDEPTSVVFGMPGEAVRLGAAKHVLPLSDIGPFLARSVTVQPQGWK
jgi:two-component system chemotaxis response regulator CheB